MVHSIFAENECEHTHPLFISVQFRSLLMKDKTGKIFIWISPNFNLLQMTRCCVSSGDFLKFLWQRSSIRYVDDMHAIYVE